MQIAKERVSFTKTLRVRGVPSRSGGVTVPSRFQRCFKDTFKCSEVADCNAEWVLTSHNSKHNEGSAACDLSKFTYAC